MKKILTATYALMLLALFAVAAHAEPASDAAQLFQDRKFDEVLKVTGDALAKDPNYAELHYWQGRVYIEREAWDKAQVSLEKAVELKKKLEEAKAYLALVYIQQEKWDQAKKLLDEGAAKSKIKARFQNHLGHYYLAKKDFSNADLAFRTALVDEPNNIEYQRDLADLNYENGVYAVAIQGYKEVLAKDSTDVVTYFKMARAHYMQKQFKDAVESLNKAIALDSNYTQAYHLHGDISMIQGLTRVAAIQEAGEGLAGANGYTDYFKNAIWAYERYQHAGGEETLDLLYRLGQAYYYVGAYDAAIEKLQKAINMGSDKSVAYDFTAKALFRLKRFDEAVNAYKAYENKISGGDPNFVWGPQYYEFFRDRGFTYSTLFYDSKREGVPDTSFLDQSIVNLKKAVELKPDDQQSLNRLGLDLYNRGLYDESIGVYEQRLALDSLNLQSYQYLAYNYLKKNDYPKAVEKLEKMYQFKPDSPFVLKTLANTYMFQLKNKPKAMEWYQKWMQLDPKDYEPYKWVGFGYITEQPPRKDMAIDNLEKAWQRIEANGVDKCKEIDVIVWLAQANAMYDDLKHDDEALKWINRGLPCNPNNDTLKKLKQNLEQ